MIRAGAGRMVFFVVLATIVFVSLILGLALRRWVFDATQQIRFQADIQRGFRFGKMADEIGYLNVYDRVASENPDDFELDYAPLRLAVMTAWVRAIPPGLKADGEWHPDYEFHRPALVFNTGIEIVGAVAIFLLVRLWCARDPNKSWAGGWIRALIAAEVFWFSPVVLLSAHGWPTWDVWVVPFYVLAIWLACIDWWFLSGCVLAIGAMLKGQQLFIAPIFMIWPLVAWRWRSALRWIAGFVFAAAVIVSPWMLTTRIDPAIEAPRILNPLAAGWILLVLAACVGSWFALTKWADFNVSSANALLAFIIGISLLLCMPFFHASRAWLDIGFLYGTYHHHDELVTGLSSNLAGILQVRQHWGSDEVLFTIGTREPIDVTTRTLLIGLYIVTLLICAIGAGIQDRRKSPRFLIAITGPWLMFFVFMPQIHERYLIFAASIGCVLIGAGAGMMLLDLFLILTSFAMTLHVMLRAVREGKWGTFDDVAHGSQIHDILNGTYPDIGWAVILCALIFLYYAITPGRKYHVQNDSRNPTRCAPAENAQREHLPQSGIPLRLP